jgi:2-amino-4-hydroxy-6-hydroxymethyldihydropteridine diphosphokinase
MTAVFLGIGSNIERERYITAGLDALQGLFGELSLSSVYDSDAIGFTGQPFLNLVALVNTVLPLADLAAKLRHIEFEHGRPANATRFSARQLDIDILTYGNVVGTVAGVVLPRDEILENAFVLRPLAELAPDAQHPVLRRSYGELWRTYDQPQQPLIRVDFMWRGRSISSAEGGSSGS